MVEKSLDCLIQARLTSSRLPNKVMKIINGKKIIDIIFDRVSRSKSLRKIIFVIPSNKKNLRLKKYLKKKNYNFFCGSEKNVLRRFYMASKKFKSKYILRITADCPFVDSNLVDKLFKYFKSKKVNYASNTNPPSFPDGFDIEIFDFNSLKEAFKKAEKIKDLEHVTPFLIRNKKLKKYNLRNKKNLSNCKLSIDTIDDFIRVKKIFNNFDNFNVSYEKILKNCENENR